MDDHADHLGADRGPRQRARPPAIGDQADGGGDVDDAGEQREQVGQRGLVELGGDLHDAAGGRGQREDQVQRDQHPARSGGRRVRVGSRWAASAGDRRSAGSGFAACARRARPSTHRRVDRRSATAGLPELHQPQGHHRHHHCSEAQRQPIPSGCAPRGPGRSPAAAGAGCRPSRRRTSPARPPFAARPAGRSRCRTAPGRRPPATIAPTICASVVGAPPPAPGRPSRRRAAAPR